MIQILALNNLKWGDMPLKTFISSYPLFLNVKLCTKEIINAFNYLSVSVHNGLLKLVQYNLPWINSPNLEFYKSKPVLVNIAISSISSKWNNGL